MRTKNTPSLWLFDNHRTPHHISSVESLFLWDRAQRVALLAGQGPDDLRQYQRKYHPIRAGLTLEDRRTRSERRAIRWFKEAQIPVICIPEEEIPIVYFDTTTQLVLPPEVYFWREFNAIDGTFKNARCAIDFIGLVTFMMHVAQELNLDPVLQ